MQCLPLPPPFVMFGGWLPRRIRQIQECIPDDKVASVVKRERERERVLKVEDLSPLARNPLLSGSTALHSFLR